MPLSPFVGRRRSLLLALPCALLVSLAAFGPRAAHTQEPARQDQQPSPTPTPTPTPDTAPSATPTPTPTPTEAEGEEVERIDTNLASVLLSATDKRRQFVTTLRPEDLRVLEDGVEQRVESFERAPDVPLSLALLVDVSASQLKVLQEEQDAASAFVRSVLRPERDAAAVISFTGIMRLEQPLTSDPERLLAGVGAIAPRYTPDECNVPGAPDDVLLRCGTAIWDAVVLSVREVLAKTPERTRRAIILLSDGDDYNSRLRIYQAVEYAVRHDTVVYSIGIRDRKFKPGEMRRDNLENISEQTGGRAFFPKRPADLSAAFAQIEQELRSQYLVSYTPTNRARDGSFRKLRIELANPALRKQNLRLLYRQGYYAKQ